MNTYLESPNGILYARSHNGNGRHAMSESDRAIGVMSELYEATIADLRAQIHEQGWLRLGEESGHEFDRETIGTIVASARAYYLKNPLIRRAVQVATFYVWGQDLTRKVDDEKVKLVIDRFWNDNQSTLTGQQASRLLEVERLVTGNLFLALFSDRNTGQVRVRQVPMEQIKEIICNPEDRADPWYYRRQWNQRKSDGTGTDQREVFYPDWRYRPEEQPASYQWNGSPIPVEWQAPILHDKSGAFPHWTWGVPEVYAALDWAGAYKRMTENDATRSASLSRWAFKMTTEGGAAGVAAGKARIGTTFGSGGGETNPPPVAGSTYIRGSKGQDLEPVDISRAILPPDHSRNARLMVASAVGLSDTILSGDVDQSSLATAESLDRPTELMYSERRQDRRDVLTELCQWVIDRDIEAPGGIIRFTPTDDARVVKLSWPDLLEKSVTARMAAIKQGATLDGQALAGTISRETVARLTLVALGVDDADDEIERLRDEWDEQDARREEMAQRLSQPGQQQQDEEREAFMRAVLTFEEALSR